HHQGAVMTLVEHLSKVEIVLNVHAKKAENINGLLRRDGLTKDRDLRNLPKVSIYTKYFTLPICLNVRQKTWQITADLVPKYGRRTAWSAPIP
ncbi:hypothetical protein EFM18_05615, partial [Limosilactobacillus fermentum]|nr:hypothetical protein [Limosilactobacillus fermentum]